MLLLRGRALCPLQRESPYENLRYRRPRPKTRSVLHDDVDSPMSERKDNGVDKELRSLWVC
jgi:hypothetical protein